MQNRLDVASGGIEVILYDADYRRLAAVLMSLEQAEAFPVEWVSPMQVYRETKGTMGQEPEQPGVRRGGRMNYDKIAVQVAQRLAQIGGEPRCRACGRENCTGAGLGPGHCDSRPLRPTLPGDAALPPPSRRPRRRKRRSPGSALKSPSYKPIAP